MEKRSRFSVPVVALSVAALLCRCPAARCQEAPDPFDLPSSRNVWAILESQEPGVVTDRVDVGGLRGFEPAHVGGFGNTWTQNRFSFGSLDITDPYTGGVPLVFPEFGFLERIRVSPAEHEASTGAPGIVVSLEPRGSGERLRAGADLFYTDGNLQSRALKWQERQAGISSPEHFGDDLQTSAHAGGPILPDGPTWFAAVSDEHLSRFPEDVSAPIRTDRLSGELGLAANLGGKAVKFLGVLQQQHDPALGTSSRQPEGSSLDAIRTAGFAALTASAALDESQTVDARAGYVEASFQDRFPSGAARQSALELFKGTLSGASPLATNGRRERYELSGVWRRAMKSGIDLEAGGEWREIVSADRSRAFDNVNLQLLDGTPSSVVLFDREGSSRQRVRDIALFGQAHLRAGNHLTISAGLRFQSSFGWLPGVSGETIRWTSLSPHIAATASAGEHATFRASYARYTHELLASSLEISDPRSLSGRVALWNDANGDAQYQPGEEGSTLRVFGGSHSTVDPRLRPPVTDEVAVGSQWHPSPGFQLEADYRQRYEKHLLETINVGVPRSSYSPVPYLDPGPDGIPGTGDDQTITVYDQDPSTLGQDRFLLTNPAGFRAFYQGLELAAISNDAKNRVRLEASFTAYRIVGEASQEPESLEYDEGVVGVLYDNPNTLIHADGRLFFDRGYVGKVSGIYRFSGDVTVGCVAKYYDGLPFARMLVVTGLNQGPFAVFATQRGNRSLGKDPRNGSRTEYALTFDIGVEKAIRLGDGRLALRIDVFNLLDDHRKTRENDLTGPEFRSRLARETQAPRVIRLGLLVAL